MECSSSSVFPFLPHSIFRSSLYSLLNLISLQRESGWMFYWVTLSYKHISVSTFFNYVWCPLFCLLHGGWLIFGIFQTERMGLQWPHLSHYDFSNHLRVSIAHSYFLPYFTGYLFRGHFSIGLYLYHYD